MTESTYDRLVREAREEREAEAARRLARTHDPATSSAAAASVAPTLTRRRAAVLDALRDGGPCHDQDLVVRYRRRSHHDPDRYPPQSESGIRSRRHELVEAGLVTPTGATVRTSSGRASKVWRAA